MVILDDKVTINIQSVDPQRAYAKRASRVNQLPTLDFYQPCVNHNSREDGFHQQHGPVSRQIAFVLQSVITKEATIPESVFDPSTLSYNPQTTPARLIVDGKIHKVSIN